MRSPYQNHTGIIRVVKWKMLLSHKRYTYKYSSRIRKYKFCFVLIATSSKHFGSQFGLAFVCSFSIFYCNIIRQGIFVSHGEPTILFHHVFIYLYHFLTSSSSGYFSIIFISMPSIYPRSPAFTSCCSLSAWRTCINDEYD